MNHEIIWIYIDKRCGGGDKLIPSRFHIQRWKGEYRSWSKNKNSWKKEKANKLLNHLWHFRPYVFALIMTDFIIINVFMHFSSVYYFKSALQFIFKRAPVMSVKWNNHIEKNVMYPFSHRRSIQVIYIIYCYFMNTDSEKLS